MRFRFAEATARRPLLQSEVSIFRDLYTRVLLRPQDARHKVIYTRGLLRPQDARHKVIGVTSALPGEGKTWFATGLATVLANDRKIDESEGAGGSVLLMDCSHGGRGAGHEFEIELTPGLIQYLRRECQLEDAIKNTPLSNLHVLPVGGVSEDLSVLIRSAGMREAMHAIPERFDVIIVDLPAILTTTDAQVLSALVDGLVMVVRSGVTPRDQLLRATDELDSQTLLGFVLNDWQPDLPGWLDRQVQGPGLARAW